MAWNDANQRHDNRRQSLSPSFRALSTPTLVLTKDVRRFDGRVL
jgi:hypothetical protein